MIRILHGDCRALLKTLPAESVNCVVTSPPYHNLRSYLRDDDPNKPLEIGSEASIDDWVETLVDVFREVRRVLRKDGTVWLNLGDSYAGSRCGGDTGLSGLQGSTDSQDQAKVAKKRHQAFTADQKEASAAAKRQMVASSRRDDLPIPRSDLRMPGLKPKDLVGQPWLLAFALRADGWFLRQDIIFAKLNPMPESVRDRCTKSHEYVFLLSKSGRPSIWQSRGTGEWLNKLTKVQKAETIMVPDPRGHSIEKKLWRACDYYYDFDAVQERVNGGAHARGPGTVRPPAVAEAFAAGDEKLRTTSGLLDYAERTRARKAAHRPADGGKEPQGWDRSAGAHGSFHPNGRGAAVPRGVNPKALLADSHNDSTTSPQGAYASGKSEKLGRGPGWRNGTKQNPSFSEAISMAFELVETRNPRSVWDGWEDEFAQFLIWKEEQARWDDVWKLPTQPFKGPHFATFPLELARRCILAGCPLGGVVLDPFGGAGTTALVADQLGRDAILMELDQRSVDMADVRVKADSPLFAEVTS